MPILLAALIVAAPAASSFAATRQGLSFSQAKDMLHERNNAIKAAGDNVESKRLTSDSLKLLHGPTVSVGAVELWGEAKIDIDRSIATQAGSMP